MEIRAVTPEEYIEACKVESIAFDGGLDLSKEPQGDYTLCRAVFKDGKICSCLDYFKFKALFNGHEVGMGGVGGVVSLPEERHKGLIRALFKGFFEEARENGDTLSYLYPFSNVYYRQFGYEPCVVKDDTTIPLSAFKGFKNDGTMRMYRPGEDIEPFCEVYNRFAAGKNFMVVRDEKIWRRLLDKDPYKNNRYIYVRYNADNKADAYIILTPQKPTVVVEEMAWASFDALRGLLGFLNNFNGRYSKFNYNAPTFLDFRILVPEPYEVETSRCTFGMARIVDVERALKTLPVGAEKVTIRVYDDFLEWNDGTFTVYAKDGEVQVERTDAAADIACDVRTLAQLLSGYLPLEKGIEIGSIKLCGNLEAVEHLFPKRETCIFDQF